MMPSIVAPGVPPDENGRAKVHMLTARDTPVLGMHARISPGIGVAARE